MKKQIAESKASLLCAGESSMGDDLGMGKKKFFQLTANPQHLSRHALVTPMAWVDNNGKVILRYKKESGRTIWLCRSFFG